MSASHKFQLALYLKSLRNIGVRQNCYLQIRTVVYHQNIKKQNKSAKPYEVLTLLPTNKQNQDSNISLQDDTFMSSKILVKHTDKTIDLKYICIFKGEISIPNQKQNNPNIFIFSQLIWFMGKQVQVISQWKGYSKLTSFGSFIDMYFSSHILTCSVEAYTHCILSQIQTKDQIKLQLIQKQKIFLNHYSKNLENLYNSCLDPLINSVYLLQGWTSQFQKCQNKNQPKKKRRQYSIQQAQKDWKYKSLTVNIGEKSKQQFSKLLTSLSSQQLLNNLKADSYNVSSYLFVLWKKFLMMNEKFPDSSYFQKLKENYHKVMDKQHWQNRIIVIGQNNNLVKQIFQQKSNSLQFCSVQHHSSQIKLSSKDMENLSKQIQRKKTRLIILVHGFQATSFDMEIIGMYFKFRNPDCHILISQSNQGLTQNGIEQCGHRLAVQIKNYINSKQLKDFVISFIGHSLGGVIIRSALRYLQLYKNYFECYVSLCSPHMGYLYHTSTIVTTSIWVMNKIKKDQSLIELTMNDNKVLNKCFMYQLSERDQLKWFNTIIFLASKQDQYVPFSSAMLQNMDFFYKSQSAKTYQNMYKNIIDPIKDKIIRLQIIFNDKVKDLSGFIGRTAHIKVLSFLPIIDLYCHLISRRI